MLSLYRSLQVTHLVVNNVEKVQDSYKNHLAAKWDIPVVSLDFISACLEAGMLLEQDKFVVVGKTASSKEFSSRKIVGECQVGAFGFKTVFFCLVWLFS